MDTGPVEDAAGDVQGLGVTVRPRIAQIERLAQGLEGQFRRTAEFVFGSLLISRPACGQSRSLSLRFFGSPSRSPAPSRTLSSTAFADARLPLRIYF